MVRRRIRGCHAVLHRHAPRRPASRRRQRRRRPPRRSSRRRLHRPRLQSRRPLAHRPHRNLRRGDENAARLSAAAIRLQIGTGESIGIVGFALAGDGPAKVLLRVLGPELATRGVTGALSDPQLFLYRGTIPVMGNDDWGSAASTPLLATSTTQVGLPALPDASKDAALLIQLEPGAYSLHVSGTDNATGVALVEVYLISEVNP